MYRPQRSSPLGAVTALGTREVDAEPTEDAESGGIDALNRSESMPSHFGGLRSQLLSHDASESSLNRNLQTQLNCTPICIPEVFPNCVRNCEQVGAGAEGA